MWQKYETLCYEVFILFINAPLVSVERKSFKRNFVSVVLRFATFDGLLFSSCREDNTASEDLCEFQLYAQHFIYLVVDLHFLRFRCRTVAEKVFFFS